MIRVSENSSIKIFSKIFYFVRDDKKIFFYLFCFGIFIAAFEVVSVGIFIPVISFFLQDNSLNTNLFFFNISPYYKSTNFIIFLMLLIFLLRFFFLITINKLKLKYTHNLSIKVSTQYLKTLFKLDYIYFTQKNSSRHIKLVDEIQGIMTGALMNVINIFIDFLIIIGLIFFLLFFDYKSTIVIFLSIGIPGLIFYNIYKNKMLKVGQERYENGILRLKNLQELFFGVKEIMINNSNLFFIDKFNSSNVKYSKSLITEGIIQFLPRQYFEFIIILFFSIITFYFINTLQDLNIIILKLTIFAISSIRLLPLLNRTVESFHNLKGRFFPIHELYEIFQNLNQNESEFQKKNIKFDHSFELKNISFEYSNENNKIDQNKLILSNINLKFLKGDIVGITGPSGCGKSTLVDIISGLKDKKNGEILVDGINVDKLSKTKWSNLLGYAPQDILILDDTIENNIIFGNKTTSQTNIKIAEILEKIKLKKFISTLPMGVQTKIGERGSRISGGQKQRIGLARILYKNPEIIILDESTNALDIEIEQEIINNLTSNYPDITFIFISHRKETLLKCNKMYEFQGNLLKKIK